MNKWYLFLHLTSKKPYKKSSKPIPVRSISYKNLKIKKSKILGLTLNLLCMIRDQILPLKTWVNKSQLPSIFSQFQNNFQKRKYNIKILLKKKNIWLHLTAIIDHINLTKIFSQFKGIKSKINPTKNQLIINLWKLKNLKRLNKVNFFKIKLPRSLNKTKLNQLFSTTYLRNKI